MEEGILEEIKEISLGSWEEFEKEINLEPKHKKYLQKNADGGGISDLLYRGQEDASWQLQTTLERFYYKIFNASRFKNEIESRWEPTGFYSLKMYNLHLLKVLPEIESKYLHKFKGESFPDEFLMGNPPPNYEFMAYLRHHGFPSPILDWSSCPYVAAYFAFKNARPDNKVAIYTFREFSSGSKTNRGEPYITEIGHNIETDERHSFQKSHYTVCIHEVESNPRGKSQREYYYFPHGQFEFGENQDVVQKYTIPGRERKKVLRKLDDRGINTFTLFKDEDSFVSMLAFNQFENR